MTDLKDIYFEDPEFRHIWHQIIEMKEELLWIGCGTTEQAKAGFKLLREKGAELYTKMAKVLEKYK